MKTFIVGILLLGVAILGAFTSYVSGRIVLPEMSLTAPEYSTWAWAWIISVGISTVIYLIKALILIVSED